MLVSSLLSFLALLGVVSQIKATPTRFPHESRSFEVRSIISIGRLRIISTERYSAIQQRARIRYNFNNTHEDYDYFFDARTLDSVSFNRITKLCSTSEEEYQKKVIHFKYRTSADRLVLDLFDVIDAVQDSGHIIGPVNILFYLAHQANRTKLILNIDDEQESLVERQLQVQLKDCKAIISAFYLSEDSSYSSTGSTLPTKVVVSFFGEDGAGKMSFNISYLSYDVINDESVYLTNEITTKSDGVLLDGFAFPISYGCNSGRNKSTKQEVLLDQDSLDTQFSFEADCASAGNSSYKLFVALDGPMKKLHLYTSSAKKNDSPINYQVWDYAMNRKYIIIDKQSGELTRLNESDERHNQCSIYNIDYPVRHKSKLPSLSSLLLGDVKFFYMGRARVMGIEAAAYETKVKSLPLWLSQPMLYNDGYRMKGKRIGDEREFHHIVVFMAAMEGENTPKQVLRLEVYERIYTSPRSFGENMRVKAINFHRFAYNLTNLPGSERVDGPYSIAEVCSAKANLDKYSEGVEVLLEADSVDNSTAWLDIPSYRNKAILNGLVNLTSDLRSGMYDISSEMSAPKGGNISFTFKLDQRFEFVNTMKFLGNAIWRGEGGRSSIASSPAECLYNTSANNASTILFYNQTSEFCIAYEIPLVKKDQDLNRNLVDFLLHHDGELFLISPSPDTNSWNHMVETLQKFNNKTIILMSPEAKQNDSRPFKMRVRQAEMRLVDHSSGKIS